MPTSPSALVASKTLTFAQALHLLQHSGLIVFPTETFLAIGCHALDEQAVLRTYQAKGRKTTKPLPLVAASVAMVAKYCDIRDLDTRLLTFWPGSLTLVLPSKAPFPAPLVDSQGCVAIRVCPHPVVQALCQELDAPLTASSANFQGQPPAKLLSDLSELMIESADGLLEQEPKPAGGLPSTIVSQLGPMLLRIHREGSIPKERFVELGFHLQD